jgi:hypothetical protein
MRRKIVDPQGSSVFCAEWRIVNIEPFMEKKDLLQYQLRKLENLGIRLTLVWEELKWYRRWYSDIPVNILLDPVKRW